MVGRSERIVPEVEPRMAHGLDVRVSVLSCKIRKVPSPHYLLGCEQSPEHHVAVREALTARFVVGYAGLWLWTRLPRMGLPVALVTNIRKT
jgi:hypothetical protein